MSRIEAVVFDLYGTLVPEIPRSRWDAMLEEMAEVLGADPPVFRAGWDATVLERQTGGFRTIEENVRAICRAIGIRLSPSVLGAALEVRTAVYDDLFRPQPGALELLGWLRERGLATALVSVCAPDTPDLWRASPLGGLVDVLVFSSEVGLRKPDPAIYLAACEGMGIGPTACLYVGDGAYRELTGAAALGMSPVRIVDLAEVGAGLRPDPDDWDGTTVRSLSEIVRLLEAGSAGGSSDLVPEPPIRQG